MIFLTTKILFALRGPLGMFSIGVLDQEERCTNDMASSGNQIDKSN